MLYVEHILIKKRKIINKKNKFCRIEEGDALRINEDLDESRYVNFPGTIVGTDLPVGYPLLSYGYGESDSVYHVLYYTFCGMDFQNAQAVGISEETFEKYGQGIYEPDFLYDLSVPKTERFGALRLENPYLFTDDLGAILNIGTTDQDDIYLAKKYDQCMKASAYYSTDVPYRPIAFIYGAPFLLSHPAVGFTYQECFDIAQATKNDDAFDDEERTYSLIRFQLNEEEQKGAIWIDSTKLKQSVIAFAKEEKHPISVTAVNSALRDQQKLSQEMIAWNENRYCNVQTKELLEECITLIKQLPSKHPQAQNEVFKALSGTQISNLYDENVYKIFKNVGEKSFCVVYSQEAHKLNSLMQTIKEMCKKVQAKLQSIGSDQQSEDLQEDKTDLIIVPDGENINVALLSEILKLKTGGIVLFVNTAKNSTIGRELLYQNLINDSPISSITLDGGRRFEVENNVKQVSAESITSQSKAPKPQLSRPASKTPTYSNRTYSNWDLEKDPEKFINYLRSQHVRYEYKTFNHATEDEVMDWIKNNNVTIISYTGRLYEYSTSKTIFSKTEWHFLFKYLKIKYYPRKPKYEQSWYYISRYTIGAYHLHDDIKNQLERENGKIIGSPIYTEYHISGGHGDTKTLTFYFYAY